MVYSRSMRETITCKQCGRVREVVAKKTRSRIFCSNRCYHRSKKGKPTPIPHHLLGGGLGAHALRGRKQSEEHVTLRIEASRRTLAKTRRECVRCKEKFKPTQFTQRYCSGRCWNAVHRRPRKPRFVIPKAAYAQLFAAQKGVCAICGSQNGYSVGGRLVVDHDHKLDMARGLLCHQCNTGIGCLKDSPELLQKAIKYLRKYLRKTAI